MDRQKEHIHYVYLHIMVFTRRKIIDKASCCKHTITVAATIVIAVVTAVATTIK